MRFRQGMGRLPEPAATFSFGAHRLTYATSAFSLEIRGSAHFTMLECHNRHHIGWSCPLEAVPISMVRDHESWLLSGSLSMSSVCDRDTVLIDRASTKELDSATPRESSR